MMESYEKKFMRESTLIILKWRYLVVLHGSVLFKYSVSSITHYWA